MKHLITEQKFFEDLLNCTKCENTEDLIDFLKTDFFGYDLICDFNDIDEYRLASETNPLWEIIMDKYDNIIFNSSLSMDIQNDNLYESLSEHNIFLLDKNVEECSKLSKNRGYIYLCIENISTQWKKFSSLSKGLHFKATNSNLIPSDQKLDNWSKLNSYLTPLTSVIIFDKYILKDGTSKKLRNNLFPLLNLICQNSNNLQKPLHISIVTEFDNHSSIEASHQILKNYLLQNNFNNVHINIAKHSKSLYPRDFEGLHSRFILTNYVHFRCDDSFNFFKPNGKINNDADLRVDFNMSKKHRHFFKKDLLDIKKYFTKLINNPDHPDPNMKITYYQDYNNHLLN